jgi:mono/diheme cytochrome c family protein
MKARTAILGAGALALAGLGVLVGAARWSDTHAGAAPRLLAAVPADARVIARGAYLARLGDCAACHSLPGKPDYTGGLRMMTPIGAIYTSNITPDREHGIGNYSLADFDRALRYGVARGHTLYPAMPYGSYARTTPADVAALYAYFMHAVAPAPTPSRASDIPFPLSMRWPLAVWRWAFAPAPQPFAPTGGDALLARGVWQSPQWPRPSTM